MVSGSQFTKAMWSDEEGFRIVVVWSKESGRCGTKDAMGGQLPGLEQVMWLRNADVDERRMLGDER